MTKKEKILKSIENLSFEEQRDFISKKFDEVKSQYNLFECIMYGELLNEKYDVYGIKFELPDLYNKAGDYEKTIAFMSCWMSDSDSLNTISLDVRPLNALCEAYVKTKNYERAISIVQLTTAVVENSLQTYANTANNDLINILKFRLAYIKAQSASVYYYQSRFSEAVECLKESFNCSSTVIAFYYAALIYEKSEEFNDYEMAIDYFEKIADIKPTPSNTEFYSFDDWCQVKANYELGMIYATADKFIDKEKTYNYLTKSKSWGYDISDEEIESIINKINTENKLKNVNVNNSGTSTNTKSNGCYVATCVYGSYDCPEVWTLRRFRDYVLKESIPGRLFIKSYYTVSPTVVKLFGKDKWFHKLFKTTLDKFVIKLQKDGIKDTPYKDN